MKKHLVFIVFFSFVIIVFLGKLILMRSAFLGGDYADQLYPWSMIYADAIKNFQFPYWTRYIHSGFPLMAEGQMGGFYPLNIAFFFLLPFKIAYNYIVIFHFVLAGFFTYIYAKKLGACQWGATLAAFLFCFGSAYAGCMINISTVKTLVWLPLILWMFENYFDKKKFVFIIGSGIILGVQLLAGSTQVGVYSVLLCGSYFIFGIIKRKEGSVKEVFNLGLMMLIAGCIFYPQFILSSTLADLSWRAKASLGFALSGSFFPVNCISLVLPYPVLNGPRFYLGVLSILFLVAGVLKIKTTPRIQPLFLFFLFSIFLGLGRFNPLFILFVKFTRMYNFRSPSKFILFSIFAASIFAGYGFTKFFNDEKNQFRVKALNIFSKVLIGTLGLFFIAKTVLVVFKGNIIYMGKWIVTKYTYGTPFHRYDLDTYMTKVEGFYVSLVNMSSLSNPFVLGGVVLCVLMIGAGFYYRGKKRFSMGHKIFFMVIIFLDLFVFSLYGTGFRGNIKGFDVLKPECRSVFETIHNDKGLFRILPYDLVSAKLPKWSSASLNAVYGIDSIALYTPLVNEYYRSELGSLEVVDNALGLDTPKPDSLDTNLGLIRMLNVKYIISPKILEKPFLNFVLSEKGIYLYELKDTLSRSFVAKELSPIKIDRQVKVKILDYGSGYAFFEVNMPYEGYLVFSENRYPGWKAYVDEIEKEILEISAIQAVKVNKGNHKVEFIYQP